MATTTKPTDLKIITTRTTFEVDGIRYSIELGEFDIITSHVAEINRLKQITGREARQQQAWYESELAYALEFAATKIAR